MPEGTDNKYRAAIDVLQRGRDVMVDALADEIIDREELLTEGSFLLNELLETQGTRLHLLTLLIGQLEHSAEMLDESLAPPPAPKRTAQRRSRAKKVQQQTSSEGSADDA